MLFIAGISLSFFLAFLLFSKKNPTIADKILGSWLVIIGIHLLFFYLHFTGQSFDYPHLLGAGIPLPLLHGPFLYLYTAALTRQLPANRLWNFVHFIPALLSYLYLIRFFVLPAREKVIVFQNKGAGFETYMSVHLAAIIASGLVYITLTSLLLQRHRTAILDQFSNTDKINLQWLQYLMYGIAGIWALVIAGNDELIFGAVVLFVLFIGYSGIRQAGIFSDPVTGSPGSKPDLSGFKAHPDKITEAYSLKHPADAPPQGGHSFPPEPSTRAAAEPVETETNPSPETITDQKKYSKSGLSREIAGKLHQDLTRLMEVEKLYTDSELSLSALAGRLQTHPNYLSQVINEKEEKNFYDYINTLRIQAFKELISKPGNQKFTLLSLAYECGFNSKSSFDRYFKKATGQSPSEYLNTLNQGVIQG